MFQILLEDNYSLMLLKWLLKEKKHVQDFQRIISVCDIVWRFLIYDGTISTLPIYWHQHAWQCDWWMKKYDPNLSLWWNLFFGDSHTDTYKTFLEIIHWCNFSIGGSCNHTHQWLSFDKCNACLSFFDKRV